MMKLSRFGIFTCGSVFASIGSPSPISLLSAPGRIGEWFSGGAGYRSSRRQPAGDGYAAAKQCSAIDEAVSGDEIEHRRAVPASPLAHAFLLNGWRDAPILRNIVL